MTLLLWNTQGNKQCLEVLLEESKYDVLAIQEPWINTLTKSTYCPRSARYHLIHAPEGRAALYINKKYPVDLWDFEASGVYCRAWFKASEGEEGLEVWSIYNPLDIKTVPSTLLTMPKPDLPTVLAGDFNLHHPLWDLYDRLDHRAEDLL